jgi:hypothetical protein
MMDLQGLAHCLERSTALQDVEICVSEDNGTMDFAREILVAMRKSVSLYRLQIRHGDGSIFSVEMQTKLQVYLARNKVLSGMRKNATKPFYGQTEIRYEPHIYPAFLVASNAMGLARSTVMTGFVGVTGDCLGL